MQDSNIYKQVSDAIESHTPCVLATVIYTANSTSATVGDKALISNNGDITGWIGGGCCQSVVKKVAPLLLKNESSTGTVEGSVERNQHCVIRVCPENEFIDGMLCYPSHCPSEGTVDIFLEPIGTQQAVHLYGNTPIAHSIARYSKELDIHLEWRQLVDQYTPNTSNQQTQNTQDQLSPSQPVSIAIVATQGQGDFIALQQTLADKAEHILLVASHKKAKALEDKAQKLGACPKAVASIISPAGIDIGASSAAEIALSIMAKVVSLKRQGLRRLEEQSELSENPQKSEQLKAETTNSKTEVTSSKTETPKATSSCCGGA